MRRLFARIWHIVFFGFCISLLQGCFLLDSLDAQKDNANRDIASLQMGSLSSKLMDYRIKTKTFPANGADMKSLAADLGVGVDKVTDPWGKPYLYTGDEKVLQLTSAGPDGNVGTEDDVIYPEANNVGH